MNDHEQTRTSSSAGAGPPCLRFDANLSDLLAGDAGVDVSRPLLQHRDSCERCRREWVVFQALLAELRTLPMAHDEHELWERIQWQVAPAPDSAAAAEPVLELLAEWKAAPLRASSERVWRAIDGKVRAEPGRSPRVAWSRVVELLSLGTAALLLVSVLWLGNAAVLEWARQSLPSDWSERVGSLVGTPWEPLFLPLVFSLVAGALALVSLPLLSQAMRHSRTPLGGRLWLPVT